MQFKSIIGQKEIKKQLLKSVSENRVSHAQLFLGADGSGTLPLALAFAQYLNCENRQPEDSCGKCASCVKSEKLIHPDIHYSYPVVTTKGSKPRSVDFAEEWRKAVVENKYMDVNDWLDFVEAENKQGNITVEECHDIIRKLSFKTYESPYKILVMWMPEYLREAGNVLLKLLEEPPANTLFILAAENQEQILSTILSRTQLVKIPKLHSEEIVGELVNNFSMEEKSARQIARMADGNFNEVLRLMKNAEDDNEQLLLQMFRSCAQKKTDIAAINKMVEHLSKIGRENQKSLFRYGLDLMREVLLLENLGTAHARLTENEIRLAAFLNEQLNFKQKEEIINLFNTSFYEVERNANPRILFYNLFIQLSRQLKNNKVVLSNS